MRIKWLLHEEYTEQYPAQRQRRVVIIAIIIIIITSF